MLDLQVINALVALGLLAAILTTLLRTLPKPNADLAHVEERLSANQQRYESGIRLRRIGDLALILAGVYCLVRGLSTPPENREIDDLPVFASFVLLCLIFAYVGGFALRTVLENRFCRDHPELREALPPVWINATATATVVSALVCFWFFFASPERSDYFWVPGLGMILFVFGRRILLREIVRRNKQVSLDTPLGMALSRMTQHFGVEPKKCIVIANLMPNAFALPGGVLAFTKRLQMLLSDEQLAAVLAHEMSHLTDKDVKKIQRRRLLGLPILFLLPMLVGFAIGWWHLPGICFIPMAVASFAISRIAYAAFLAKLTVPIEYKCDAAAKDAVDGKSMAEALLLLHAAMGQPRRYIGLDALTLTHPSLDDRVKRLV